MSDRHVGGWVVAAALALGACAQAPDHVSPAAASPALTQTTLGLSVTVVNGRYGTAIPSDFTVTVTRQGQEAAVTHGHELLQAVNMPSGTRYSVGITGGPDGYAMQLSPSCTGVAAEGQAPCAITLTEAPVTCENAWWEVVYLKFRLKMLNACEVATGRVESMVLERDADLVIRIAPDPAFRHLLRPGNQFSDGHLIVEVPCQGTIVQADAMGTCDGFKGHRIPMPAVGSRVLAAGPWVEDTNHHRWGELHGARLMVLPR